MPSTWILKQTTVARYRKPKGFALVATLSLLVLLSILAVGLLSLSAVTLRSASQGSAQAEARANAKLALMIAIGELQKFAGPDRAITATSEILATPSSAVAKPNTTGVWESWWDFNPNSAPNYNTEKTNRFRRWLVSNADLAATQSRDFVTQGWTGKTIELVGSGSLGSSATAASKVTAGLVPVSKNGKTQGSYAWHVSDESVKARVNIYRDPSRNTTLADKRSLLAGHRPDPSVIRGADGNLLTSLPTDLSVAGFANAKTQTGKIINLEQAELLAGARGKIRPLRNDITSYSLGVLSDVRGGGLKQDLSSMFEMGNATTNTLPSEFTSKKLYESTHGITGISDPNWSTLAGYYNSFRILTNPETSPSIAVKPQTLLTTPVNGSLINPVPVDYNPAPVIVKVDTIYSIVARPIVNQAGWLSRADGPRLAFDYMLNLIITPVVTLHNPYNVNISFHQMEVSFRNIPVALNFMFQSNGVGNFVSQSVVPGTFEAANTMIYTNAATFRSDRSMVMTIADWANDNSLSASNGRAVTGSIVLKPGQTLICGPTLPPNSSYDQDTKSGTNAVGFDWENDLLSSIKARPTFRPGLGFESNSVTISNFRWKFNAADRVVPTNNGFYPGAWWGHGMMFLRDAIAPDKLPTTSTASTDRFYVEYKVQRPDWYLNNSDLNMRSAPATFAVTAKLQASASDTLKDYARLQFNYGDANYLDYPANTKPAGVTTANTNLNNLFNDKVYRYPPTGSLSGSQVAAPKAIDYGSQFSFTHPFAIFSAYSRTTNGGVYETGSRTKSAIDSPQLNLLKDGRLAGKPYLFHNPSQSNFTMNLANEKIGGQAYELNFQPFLSKGDFQDYMDVDFNRIPALTGNKTTTGIKSGSYLEIPSGPLQTIADFRRSNALTTSYLPQFVQPVSNSLLNPLMSADKVIESNPSITTTSMLDHSVLANHALYDRFYFSTFATRGATKPDAVFEQFMDGSAPLASQSFQPYLPSGKTLASAKNELFASGLPKDTAYKFAAEHQMIRGAFNVNSTSVQAWKAVLASMNKSDVHTLWARTAGLETKPATGVPILAMSLVNGGTTGNPAIDSSKIDKKMTNDWNGYRELSEAELDNLATKIVGEVRERGPFLSMSEFVNRRIGSSSDLTIRGALEAAITKAEINEKIGAIAPSTYLEQVPVTAANINDPKLYAYKTPEATTGNPAAGAPGWVSQGDLLRILEPSATVRGDTFVIRTYGEAQDTNGNITARAYAEAVVQRVPDYVDPANRPSVNTYNDPAATAANKTFGRRMELVSFRWLSKDEI